jgi:hypothetical protein
VGPFRVTFAIIKDVALFVLALYGAALSTFNWRQAVRKERRNIKVKEETFSQKAPS